MTGTLINAAAVIAGSLIGIFFKRCIKEELNAAVQKALGLAVLFIGINGVIANMFTGKADGTLASSGELLLIFSLVLGSIAGTLLRIDDRLNSLGDTLEKKFHLTDFSAGIVNATLLFCVGAMAIIGSLNDGLTGDSSVLIVKSALDFTASIVLAASLGWGVLFSFIPLTLYQGGISLAAGALSDILAGEVLRQVCSVGYVLIFCIGVNFLWPKKIKTADLLPALLIPVLWHGLQTAWTALAL
ncbi:MAG: DUF554 domain-containing protein [Oscillospiraceae bacterium]|nr:DUF554 domain-containing protein [Oscillospiraceae bacterium]